MLLLSLFYFLAEVLLKEFFEYFGNFAFNKNSINIRQVSVFVFDDKVFFLFCAAVLLVVRAVTNVTHLHSAAACGGR